MTYLPGPGGGDDGGSGGSGGDGGSGGSGGEEDESLLPTPGLPTWVSDLRGLLGATITLGGATFALTEEPVEFVRAAILELVLSGIITLITGAVGGVLEVFATFTDVLDQSGRAVLESLGPVGGALLGVVGVIEEIAVGLAAGSGPAAPFVVVGVWGVSTFAGAIFLRNVLELVIVWR